MIRTARRTILAVSMAAVLPLSVHGEDDRTAVAIDKGINYLLPKTEERLRGLLEQFSAGPAAPTQDNGVGRLAMEVYALVVAGVSVEHPVIQKSFEFLNRMAFTHTYSVALYIFALDAAISQVEDDVLFLQPQKVRARFRDDPSIGREYRPRLQSAVESFIRSQNQRGVWRYGPGAQDFDNSNVQFAVLALGIGAKRNVQMDPAVWMKIMDHFVGGQQKDGPETKDRLTMKPLEERGMRRGDDVKITKVTKTSKGSSAAKKGGTGKTGVRTVVKSDDPELGTEDIQVFQRGWDYENKGGATWNMTCAGLSSLLLARDALRGTLPPDSLNKLNKAIWDGYGWLMGHWSPTAGYYGMYSLEKVGDIGEVLKFAGHDWYAEMSDNLLSSQQPDGSWPQNPGGHAESAPIATAYALLILNRATSLLAMDRSNKTVLSGRKSNAEGQQDRSWVYIRELDTSLNAPQLFRTVRLRPSAKLIKFLERIVESYDADYRGEIVPDLVSIRDALEKNQPKAAKVIDEYLVKITGCQYDKPEQYLKWVDRWARVREIGETMNASRKDDLLQYYKTTSKSVPLKKLVIWALVRCKIRDAAPLFLEDLDNADPVVRREAYNGFKQFFIELPPQFDENGSQETRTRQVAEIRAWFAKQT